MPRTALLLHDGAFVDAAVAADQHVVFDDHRQRAYRFEHAADLRCGREVAVLADLGTAPISAWESTMAPSPTYAPTLMYMGGMQVTPRPT